MTGRLASLIDRVAEAGLAPPGHPSPIIPVILGSEQAALNASAALLHDGLWVPGHPATDGAGRHQPPAGHTVGCAQRRGCQPVVHALSHRRGGTRSSPGPTPVTL